MVQIEYLQVILGVIVAVLKNDVKRITLTVPKQFLIELDNHINNFAFRFLHQVSHETKLASANEPLQFSS